MTDPQQLGKRGSRASAPTAETIPNPLAQTDLAQKRRGSRFLARLRRSVLPLAVVMTSLAAWAKAPNVTATLRPAEIPFGDAARLTVTVQGQDAGKPEIPPVSGLAFHPVGQSSQIQVINGTVTGNVSHDYAVTASRLGTFTIPKIRVGVGRDAGESQPLVLKVLKRTGTIPPAGSGQNAVPAPTASGGEENLSLSEREAIGFLRIVSPKQEFFVGEQVPVELKAYFRAGVELRVDGLPTLNSDAFTMNKLGDQPARSQQLIGGVPYTLFTWSTAITAVKAGEYALSVELPTTVTVHQRAQRSRSRNMKPFGDAFFDDFFNDPFFNNFFGSATQKQVALSSQPGAVKIQSLPAENRPPSFTGAVGNFDFAACASPSQTAAGDPVTLKLTVTGSGNFDRVTAPTVEKGDAWKTYKPSAKFEAADSSGCSGTKTFEQALVPAKTGKLEIPELTFSFFDPTTKQYVTRTTKPLSIEVAPALVATATVPAPTLSETNSPIRATTPATASTGSELAANKEAPGWFVSTLRPWFLNPLLAASALLSCGALVAGLGFVCRKQSRARDPQNSRLANVHRVVEQYLKAMEGAAQRGATPEFFAAACGALKEILSLRWGLPARTITLAEINARMNGEADGFRPVFALADEVAYTGRAISAQELRRWHAVVSTELRKLEEF